MPYQMTLLTAKPKTQLVRTTNFSWYKCDAGALSATCVLAQRHQRVYLASVLSWDMNSGRSIRSLRRQRLGADSAAIDRWPHGHRHPTSVTDRRDICHWPP